MKFSLLPNNVTALAAVGLLLSCTAAFAQTTRTIKGAYHSTDGHAGTFVETIDKDGDTTTDTTVYTRKVSKETSTDIFVTVTDATTNSYTVAYTHTDFGSTAQFTSNKTVDKVGGGYVGTGTYTDATGVTGTLSTLETNADHVNVRTTAYTPSTGTGTKDLRVEEDALGLIVVKTLTVEPDGTTHSAIVTKYVRE